jgi:hypothetical protein
MPITYLNPQGGASISSPLPIFAGTYFGGLSQFTGATTTTGTLKIGPAAPFAIIINSNGLVVPTANQLIPTNLGVQPVILTIAADTITVYFNVLAIPNPETCNPSNQVNDSYTPALQLTSNGTITDLAGTTSVILSFSSYANNNAALLASQPVGTFYWNTTTNTLLKVV